MPKIDMTLAEKPSLEIIEKYHVNTIYTTGVPISNISRNLDQEIKLHEEWCRLHKKAIHV